MKYYKLKNENFSGFYDSKTCGEKLESDGYYKLSDEKWKKLLNSDGEIYYSDGELISGRKSRNLQIKEGTITLDTEKEKARTQRLSDFEALDLYDKAVLRGDTEETDEEKVARDTFRTSWLNLPDSYININMDITTLYPPMPEKIKFFK
jgi:hypothetical protein